jgi:hypothetical protein
LWFTKTEQNLIFSLRCSRRADHMGPGKSSTIVNSIPDCSRLRIFIRALHPS